MLRGVKLLQELAATSVPIRLKSYKDGRVELSPEAAIRLVLSKGNWEGKARTGRVYWIRPTSGVPTELDPKHWDGRACIRFHPDQTSVPLKTRNKRYADAWGNMALDPPAYMVRQ